MLSASPTAKVHGVLTILLPMKLGKNFDRITGTFVFHTTTAVPPVNARGCDTNFIAFLVTEVAHILLYIGYTYKR